jgi:uncharacterized membrane protein
METSNSNTRLGNVRIALLIAFIALTALTTVLIRVPIPATTGYFNLGDIFIVSAGLLFGPLAGLIVGAIGAGGADLFGYPQFFPATFVTKGLEGLVVGLLSRGINLKPTRALVAAAAGSVLMVAGYFIFEAFIYPFVGAFVPFFNVTNFQEALVEIVPNIIQAVIGTVGGLGVWRALKPLTSLRS